MHILTCAGDDVVPVDLTNWVQLLRKAKYDERESV